MRREDVAATPSGMAVIVSRRLPQSEVAPAARVALQPSALAPR